VLLHQCGELGAGKVLEQLIEEACDLCGRQMAADGTKWQGSAIFDPTKAANWPPSSNCAGAASDS